jgi:hypothetical protein
MIESSMKVIRVALVAIALTGCATHYATPGPGARLAAIADITDAALRDTASGGSPGARRANTDPAVNIILDKKPFASFPASIAVVRVQGPGYVSCTTTGWGRGAYSLTTERDVESEQDMEKLDHLPQVRGVAPLNRLLLPDVLQNDYELRQAAAKLHADILLIYTLDTTFRDLSKATPLSVVTLGIGATTQARVMCTASAALIDTRSGYVYGVAEGTQKRDELRNAWATEADVDQTRRDVEDKAFAKLVANLQTTWADVLREQSKPAGAAMYQTP